MNTPDVIKYGDEEDFEQYITLQAQELDKLYKKSVLLRSVKEDYHKALFGLSPSESLKWTELIKDIERNLIHEAATFVRRFHDDQVAIATSTGSIGIFKEA